MNMLDRLWKAEKFTVEVEDAQLSVGYVKMTGNRRTVRTVLSQKRLFREEMRISMRTARSMEKSFPKRRN